MKTIDSLKTTLAKIDEAIEICKQRKDYSESRSKALHDYVNNGDYNAIEESGKKYNEAIVELRKKMHSIAKDLGFELKLKKYWDCSAEDSLEELKKYVSAMICKLEEIHETWYFGYYSDRQFARDEKITLGY